ncbi:MAG: type I restriction endonuclease, partial [Halomonas sp.]|uniref:type I restriction endonuclease n=1 Tax=Halomonas sp. TaxID=1486246 RepID=UPI00397057F1
MDKKALSERDICTKFITPALERAGWDIQVQVREEVSFTAGRIIVRGRLHTRGKRRRADYLLSYQKHQPIAVIEAKDNKHGLGDGMQQALAYSDALDVPFVFSSNGDGFLFHDRTGLGGQTETVLGLDDFPSPDALVLAVALAERIGGGEVVEGEHGLGLAAQAGAGVGQGGE